ncbi:HEAT repeat-containing protein, putative isoform 1 [Theobroma cacao]|uniref:HEAT repeat-containing protein, putative isoform 1 n=1 Tax=Theobroma cacao TaxID=3641 RepID=A0A061EHX6_THECC|nr:HEAT repeat-containing protein, putative isoform 1 [Theobroma cacao]
MARRNYVRENVPLSRFGVLVAQLESIVASASQKSPDPLLCFDLLSDLLSALDDEPKESILLWQRKCEDALYSLLILGAKRPVRHLASVAMARIISKGDSISIYSRASSLQGFLSDGKRSEPQRIAGAAQCLGELYRHFGRRITSGLLETTIIATKLMKFHEEFVRQEALLMLQNALVGSGGSAAASAYTEAFRLITRFAIGDKAFVVRIAAARCLKAFANIGGPGLGVGELDSLASNCVKALEDPITSVRDAFAEALGSLIALGMNPEAQVQPRGKGPFPPAKKLEGGLQRHLALPFTKASTIRSKDIRVGLTLSWVFFLQAIRLKYLHPDIELQNYALNVMDMLRMDMSVDAHALACVLYILRVGVTDQMTEPTQRSFTVFLGKQLQSPEASPSMKIAALRTLSYTLKTLGEVPHEFKEVLDNTVVAAVSHSAQLVRVEAALTLRALAEVDPTCVGGLISYGVTTLNALRESVSFEKGSNLKVELDSLHGQATVLAALVSISPKLPFGYPARLPKSVLEVSRKMLTEFSRNAATAMVEEEAGWLLLSSLLSAMPKEELEDQVFDILSLWADLFSGNPEDVIRQSGDLQSRIRVWSAAIDALTSFVRCFVSSNSTISGILLQPVILYLNRALSYISLLAAKEQPNIKPAMDVFIIRTLMAYQSLPDPMAYRSDHSRIIQLCTVPYRNASGCEESSCLRFLLDRRDAWLGPWIPGRDWFEDELRAFQGGKDGLMPCVWDNEISSFPQPETINKMFVNQMLLCFGIIFAAQNSGGMLSLLGMMEQCLKAGKRQPWHAASVTNICVGLLAGLKALLALRPQSLELEILNLAQAIFKGILIEGDICASQRRASSEGLGLLARLGSDIFTARMTRLLLGELNGITDSNYAGSIALSLGCIHRSAGGMALSTLVPTTVSSISLLAKSAIPGLQIWSLHGLLLTIEAAGLSFVSHVQATLGLALEILLSEEIGRVDLQQGVGRLINAIVAVLGPELASGSIFFSRCKSVIAEISSSQETATVLESVRFTQQLVLFAPHAASVHSHVQTLLLTLSSRQPMLRHLAVSTVRHLIEKDPVSIIDEQIEDNLFRMLDEETDSEIGNLIRGTIIRLLYVSCPSRPSRWISICRNMVLSMSTRATAEISKGSGNDSVSGPDGDSRLNFGDDDENMVYSSKNMFQGHAFEASNVGCNRDKHLRYRTRVFAAECLSYLPEAVGKNPAHFDLSLAMRKVANGQAYGDWLILQVQELISVAYQISTIQFENMRPIGVGLLSSVVDKFETVVDPELPGHVLLEQYQAQLISAVRTALDTSSGPILLEAGLQLATKIMTSGIISGDQVAVKRIFSLISHPLDDFKDLYYPSFAEWVSCKIKVRLLAAHASLKCYTYAFLRRHQAGVPDEYLALLPLFSRSSSILGKYWIWLLKDYCYICLRLNLKRNWNSFLDAIQARLVSSKLKPCLEEAWPVILQALALDAVPVNVVRIGNSEAAVENISVNSLVSGYSMVELESEEYQFLWSFALLVLFQGQHPAFCKQIIPLASSKAKHEEDSPSEDMNSPGLKFYEIVLPVFQFLLTQKFFSAGFLTVNICEELLQVFSYSIYMDNSWNSLAISVLSQIVHNCPEDFLGAENFTCLVVELCVGCLFRVYNCASAISLDQADWEDLISPLFIATKTIMRRSEPKKQLNSVALAFLLIGYKFIRQASTELSLSKVTDFVKSVNSFLKKLIDDASKLGDDAIVNQRTILCTSLNEIAGLTKDCIEGICLLHNKRSDLRKLLLLKLAFSMEQIIILPKIMLEIQCLEGNKDSDPIYFSVFKFCTNCMQTILNDSNVQVQAIGLQVLKSMVQKSSTVEDNSSIIFIIGELVGDILTIIKNTLKKPMTKESVAIAGECLQVLMLLQTLSKGSECQRRFMSLLLEPILMIFSALEDDCSQEVNDIRSTALRLVSHLAQIPSSADHLKDVLLSMPKMHRQQLQGVIRASITQDHGAAQMKSMSPALEIKLPVPVEGRKEDNFLSSATQVKLKQQSEESDLPPSANPINTNNDDMEEDEEDEDDWDTFQSFPASKNTAESDSVVENVAKDPGPDENSSALEIGTVDFEQHPSAENLSNVETTNAEHSEFPADIISDGSGDRGKMELLDSLSNPVIDPHENQDREGNKELISSTDSEVREVPNNGNEKMSSDLQVVEDAKVSSVEIEDYEQRRDNPVASTEPRHSEGDEGSVNAVEDHEHQEESPDNKVDASHAQAPEGLAGNEAKEEAEGEIYQLQNKEAGEDVRERTENKSNVQERESQDNLEPPNKEADKANLESGEGIDKI